MLAPRFRITRTRFIHLIVHSTSTVLETSDFYFKIFKLSMYLTATITEKKINSHNIPSFNTYQQ